MISRIFIPVLFFILLPDIYIYMYSLRLMRGSSFLKRLLWWMPSIVMVLYTIALSLPGDFAPADIFIVNIYLFLFGTLVVPKVIFVLFSCIGLVICRLFRLRTNPGNIAGLLFALLAVFITIYGSTVGFRRLEVRRVEYCSADIPAAFDGYRILHFSDAHVGSYTGNDVEILVDAVRRINEIGADVIVFTGDLQNMHPREILPVKEILSGLHAKDGVFSVLGNHDYADYLAVGDDDKRANEQATIDFERDMGWQLLLDEHRVIRRGNDSIVIAGMENDGRPPFPKKGDIKKALAGVDDGAFIVMLQHDPTSWRRTILPCSSAQLTLSGHTHAMQFSLFGWSPASLVYDEWGGMYYDGDRVLNVSMGLGGFIPFRFGASAEVVEIVLRMKKK